MTVCILAVSETMATGKLLVCVAAAVAQLLTVASVGSERNAARGEH